MSDKINFTKQTIAELPVPAAGRTYTYDSKQAHLCVCVTSNGTRTFYWYGRIDGRPERIKLGRFPTVTIENARKAAASHGGDVAKGINPKRKQGKVTLQELFDYWLSDAKLRKRTWLADQKTWDFHFATLRKRRLTEVTGADVARWHAKIGKDRGQYIANRARALLSAIYGKAKELGHSGPNPCAEVKRFSEVSRDRFLLSEEMRPFFEAVKREPPLWRDFWLLCLFTGARRGNVASMKWADVDLDRGVWYLAGMQSKNKQSLAIVLPPPAVAILESRRNSGAEDVLWVFPSADSDGHVMDPRKSWARVTATADIENLRPHDLRRSLGSWQTIAGSSLQIVGQSLGHRDPKATAIYARLIMEPVRESVNRATTAMIAAAKPRRKRKDKDGKAKAK